MIILMENEVGEGVYVWISCDNLFPSLIFHLFYVLVESTIDERFLSLW